MNKISLNNKQVTIDITGWDRLWSFKNKVSFAQNNIINVFKYNQSIFPPWFRNPGTATGKIIAGTYQNLKNRREFWCTHFSGNTIVIDLEGEEYNRIVCDLPEDESVDKWIGKLTTNL
jgi:hypothetical protein